MSLIASALQLATVRALREAGVQAIVFDSAADPRTLTDKLQAVVIVATISARFKPAGREMFNDAGNEVELVLDCALARKITRTYTDSNQAVIEVDFPDSDSAHDLALHTLAYECKRALFTSLTPWADVWRRLWNGFSQAEASGWTRGRTADEGTRLAVLRNTWQLETLADPTPGVALPSGNVWADLLALMAADTSVQKLGALWSALIQTPPENAWQAGQAALGLSLEEVYGLGFGPVSETTDDPFGPSVEISGKDEGEDGTDPTPATVTADPTSATITEDGGSPVVIAEP